MEIPQIWKNGRFVFRLSTSYIKTNWRLFGLSLVLGLIGIVVLPRLLAAYSRPRPEIIGIVGNYTVTTLPLTVQHDISHGLTDLLPDGEATPAAALFWEATNSGQTVNFKLKTNLIWQDGTNFSAEDINYNLKGVKINKVGRSEVQFILKEPFSPLLTVVSQPLFKNGLVGLGRYRVQSVKFNGRFVSSLDLFDTKTGAGKSYKFFPSEQTAILALKLGLVDNLVNIQNATDFLTDKHYKVTAKIEFQTVAAVFYNMREKAFAEKTFRQGLTYALPNEFKGETAANSPISPLSWAYNRNTKPYPQNMKLAQEMVGKSATESGTTTLKLVTDRNLLETAEVVANSWRAIGVPTTVIPTDVPPTYFDVYLTYVNIPPDPDQYFLWHSTQTGNISGYKSPKVDRYLEDGRKTLDQDSRLEIYLNFQKTITEDVPAAFLYYPRMYAIKRI